jgi:hypothetical protein
MTGETEMLARIKAIAAAASPVDRALFDRIVGCGCGVGFRQLRTCLATRSGRQWARNGHRGTCARERRYISPRVPLGGVAPDRENFARRHPSSCLGILRSCGSHITVRRSTANRRSTSAGDPQMRRHPHCGAAYRDEQLLGRKLRWQSRRSGTQNSSPALFRRDDCPRSPLPRRIRLVDGLAAGIGCGHPLS